MTTTADSTAFIKATAPVGSGSSMNRTMSGLYGANYTDQYSNAEYGGNTDESSYSSATTLPVTKTGTSSAQKAAKKAGVSTSAPAPAASEGGGISTTTALAIIAGSIAVGLFLSYKDHKGKR